MFKNLKPLRNLILLISYPLFVIVCIGFFITSHFKDYLKELLAFALLTGICLSIILLIKGYRSRKYFTLFSLTILTILTILKLSFYVNYGVKISASALYVIFETNTTEASEFLTQYLNLKVIGVIIISLMPFIYIVYTTYFKTPFLSNNLEFKNRYIESKHFKLLYIIFIIGAIVSIHYRLREENLLMNSYYAYIDYNATKANLKKDLAQTRSNYIKNVKSKEEQQTYIVIIGESTSSWHMQLYGYKRETNPLLSKLKDEMTIFNNVISPNVHTIVALDKILTQSNFKNPYKKENTSIVQLANEAGFSTHWISNQRPVGLHESVPTLIGSAANHTYFLNTNNAHNVIYDEIVLPTLDAVLNKQDKKKIVFIHLIGTHRIYNKRYPKTFNYFNDKTLKGQSLNESKVREINEYDNAIRYNDSIVYSIIQNVKAKNENSYVLYFSDHGDEVYDTMDLSGHNEYHGTKPMYEIPFIVWTSEKYKQTNDHFKNFENYTNRKYVLEDFIHSFSDLSKIEYDGYDGTKSIFNSTFIERPRLIRKGRDYDEK